MHKVQTIAKTRIANFLITTVHALYYKDGGVFNGLRKIYFEILNTFGMSVLPILSADAYSEKYQLGIKTPIKSNRIGLSGNCVFLDQMEENQTIPLPMPDINLHEFYNVCIFGNSDIIVDTENQVIVNNECYNHDKDLFHVDGMLYRDMSNVGILRTNLKQTPEIIREGIMISGKFSYNYYHQVYENLIRLLLLDEVEIPQYVPIIVDEKVSQISSLKSILVNLNCQRRNVIYLKPNKQYKVDRLYYFDHINKLSPHVAHFDEKSYRHFIYDPYYLNKLSDICLRDKSTASFPKRFYISRKNASYRKYNDEEITKALEPYGFQAVYPEEYSFTEQVALFNSAEFIIGGTGAAFTNLLFCSQRAKIVILNPIANHIQLPVFSTIAYIRECKLFYYEPAKSKSQSVHANCDIDTTDLISKLQSII